MKKDLRPSLVVAALLFSAIILTGFWTAESTPAMPNSPASVTNEANNRWEYRAIPLAPGVNQVLNTDVSDFNWELLAATDSYVIFRRVVN